MHKNFAMMVLQMVSHTRAEACPPPCVNTTNKLQPFGHRRGKKTSTRPIRFAQLAEPVLPLGRNRCGFTKKVARPTIGVPFGPNGVAALLEELDVSVDRLLRNLQL